LQGRRRRSRGRVPPCAAIGGTAPAPAASQLLTELARFNSVRQSRRGCVAQHSRPRHPESSIDCWQGGDELHAERIT
jgi:hypothetical protein